MSEQQILTDPNSPGWRYLRDEETLQAGDEYLDSECMWCLTDRVGEIAGPNVTYRRRIQQEPEPSQPQQLNDSETVEGLRQQLAADAALQQKRRALAERADSVLSLLRLTGVEIVELQHGDIVYRIVRDEWELCKKAICRRIRNLTGEEI